MEGIFLDTDILFYSYAISSEKLKKWELNHDTGDKNLNFSLKILELVKENKWRVFISDASITELLGVLQRRNSKKTASILRIIFKDFEIKYINSVITKIAWILSAHFGFHAGDSIHLSTILYFKIPRFALLETDFIKKINHVKDDFENRNGKYEDLFTIFPDYAQQFIPNTIIKGLNNIINLELIIKESF